MDVVGVDIVLRRAAPACRVAAVRADGRRRGRRRRCRECAAATPPRRCAGRTSAAALRRRHGGARARWWVARLGSRRSAHRRSRRTHRWCWHRRCAAPCRRAPAPAAGGGCGCHARRWTAAAPGAAPHRPGRPGGPVSRHRPGCPAAARRRPGARPRAATASRSGPARASARAAASARAGRYRRNRRSAAPAGARGGWAMSSWGESLRGTMRRQFKCRLPHHEFHHPAGAREPQLRGAARRADPVGRHPPGHRLALRLPRRRLRLLQEPAARRPRHPRRTPAARAVHRRRGRRPDPALLRRGADRLRDRSAQRARRGRVPGAEDAGTRAEPAARRGRRDDRQAAAAGQPEPAVPRRPVHRDHPARRRAAQLFDGQCLAPAGQPAGAGTAPAPPAGRQVHRPCVRRDEGQGDPAHRRALRQLLPARGVEQADRAAGRGHRLRADQGADRAHAAEGHHPADVAVLGLPHARRPVPARLGRSRGGADAQPALRAGAVRKLRRRLDRPQRAGAPRGDGRCARPVRPPGLCLRRAGDGGIGAQRLRRTARPAGRRVLCRLPSRPKPTSIRPCKGRMLAV